MRKMRRQRRSGAHGQSGQSMVEVAFLLPVLLIMVLAAVDVAQVLSAQQRLENATYEAALRLGTTPGFNAPAKLSALIQQESGLSPVSAAATYSIASAGADQVVVTATYSYPLILPGLRNLQIGSVGSGSFAVTVSSANIAATSPPTVTDTAGSVTVIPPSDMTVPSGLALTCALYQNTTPVSTPQPCASAMWSHTPVAGVTNTYTATVMQVNGVTSPLSTPVAGP